ncbi:hypothetical protein BAE30_06300 [Acidithiobacillus caldus]|uniref:Uncharacterized protein n=1 Tax=Acidithiobacillus caldus TaxID=33059 RepID=A0A1E7YWY6_9PROT|nr:hypothetical protein BAE30_06300 [Acidithiobacillus caldus]
MSDENNKVLPITGRRRPPAAGMGRKKGVPNRLTASVKQMILGALDDLGGQAWLTEQARADPRAFMSLLGRILPSEIQMDANVTAHPPITKITRVIVDPKEVTHES